MAFKCIKCKKPTSEIKFMWKDKMTKIGICVQCFDKRQKWRKQRGLLIESGR